MSGHHQRINLRIILIREDSRSIYVLQMATSAKPADMRDSRGEKGWKVGIFSLCIYSFGLIDRSILKRDIIICELRKGFVETQHCHHHGDRFFRDSWLVIITTLLIYILFGLVMGQDITKD